MGESERIIRDALARLEALYGPLDDLWAAKRGDPSRDAYDALGVALVCLDDARESLERAHAALARGTTGAGAGR